ncbi:MAG: ABC transporter substrate-binding protein [Geminicoccaceae bacterium]|jgi:peptide/nickel transport system substrate-binding protein|nr:ABC transporter substrate-binding protein [Geminicoccaceae bacterium]
MSDPRLPFFDRRTFFRTTTAIAGAAVMPRILAISPAMAQAGSTMVIAAPATPQSLDCNFDVSLGTFEAIGALYDGLLGFEKIPDPGVPDARREDISFHPELPGGVNMVGKLAESWELDPSGTRVVFKLREGVMSNWGNELTAEDVRWTWNRAFELGALGAFYTAVSGLTSPDDVRVEDKYVVSFNTQSPNPLLLKIHTNLYTPVYDSTKCKEVGGTDDPWARKFIENDSAGFGPYRLQQLTRGQQAVFAARDDYYGGKPAIDTVVFREVPTSAARVQLLQGGAVDIAQYLQPLEIISLQRVPNVVVETVPASFMIWIQLNAKMAPFDNVDVRRAMNFAFPQQQVLETVYQGLASPLDGCMPNIYPGFAGEFFEYEYDPAKAKELLAGAGFADGFTTSLSYNAGDPVQEPIAIIYQSALREIGVELELKKVPAGSFYNMVTERGQPMIFYVDSPWCPDPGYSLTLYFDSKSYVNYSNYANAEVDRLIAETAATADEAARLDMMRQAQEIIMREAPWVFVAYPNYTMARKADIEGWTYYTSNNIRFQDFNRA